MRGTDLAPGLFGHAFLSGMAALPGNLRAPLLGQRFGPRRATGLTHATGRLAERGCEFIWGFHEAPEVNELVENFELDDRVP